MKNTLPTLLAAMLLSIQAAQADTHLSLLIGSKALDEDDWQAQQTPSGATQNDLQDQATLGLLFDFKPKQWPVHVAIDAFLAGDSSKVEGQDVTGGGAELHLGLRKYWQSQDQRWLPYIGGGLSHISVVREQFQNGRVDDDSDTALGAWVGAGIRWQASDSIQLGLDLRYSEAEAKLYGQDYAAGGLYSGFSLGYRWP